jgi:hypothetical protein
MFITAVHFDSEQLHIQNINFLLIPKLGEIIAYGNNDNFTDYRVDKIVHRVDMDTNNASIKIELYVSKNVVSI